MFSTAQKTQITAGLQTKTSTNAAATHHSPSAVFLQAASLRKLWGVRRWTAALVRVWLLSGGGWSSEEKLRICAWGGGRKTRKEDLCARQSATGTVCLQRYRLLKPGVNRDSISRTTLRHKEQDSPFACRAGSHLWAEAGCRSSWDGTQQWIQQHGGIRWPWCPDHRNVSRWRR